jgi:hypothetical protein
LFSNRNKTGDTEDFHCASATSVSDSEEREANLTGCKLDLHSMRLAFTRGGDFEGDPVIHFQLIEDAFFRKRGVK